MTQVNLAPYDAEWLKVRHILQLCPARPLPTGEQKMEQNLGGRSVLKGTVEEQRTQFAGLGAALAPLAPPLPDILDIEDVMISDTLRVRVYSPKEGKGKLPFGLYMHCGGFVMGGIEVDDYFCRVISLSAACVIVSVEYRLAPENKYPAAHDDSYVAFDWAYANASNYGALSSRGFTIGQSAGANMAISLALRVKQSSQPDRVKGVVALAPPVVASSAIPKELATGFNGDNNLDSAIIDSTAMDLYLSSYGPPPLAPEYSVLLSQKLSLLPLTYLVVCGKDPLRDDGLVFEKALKGAGVNTKLDYYEGWPHMFWIIPGLKKGDEAIKNIVTGVQWVISSL